LAQWKGSVARRDGVTMSIGGETTPGSGKGGGDCRWADANFTGPKNEENQHG
jgi:hypothetical protein